MTHLIEQFNFPVINARDYIVNTANASNMTVLAVRAYAGDFLWRAAS